MNYILCKGDILKNMVYGFCQDRRVTVATLIFLQNQKLLLPLFKQKKTFRIEKPVLCQLVLYTFRSKT